MINGHPPRDAPLSAQYQNVPGNDITYNIHVPCRNEDATGSDILGEGLSQSSPPIPQQGHFFVNTSGLDPSSSPCGETIPDTAQSTVSQRPFSPPQISDIRWFAGIYVL